MSQILKCPKFQNFPNFKKVPNFPNVPTFKTCPKYEKCPQYKKYAKYVSKKQKTVAPPWELKVSPVTCKIGGWGWVGVEAGSGWM